MSRIELSGWERILPNEVEVDPASHGSVQALAKYLLSVTASDPLKYRKRQAMLAEQPEKRRRVNTDRLRGIIDYALFMCHPNSSVARDEAVYGSDIDGGLVVTPAPVDNLTTVHFVDELRAQGFDVYHPTEAEAAHEYWMSILGGEVEATDRECGEASLHDLRTTVRQITFVSRAAIEAQAAHGPFDPATAVYLAGFSIPEWQTQTVPEPSMHPFNAMHQQLSP